MGVDAATSRVAALAFPRRHAKRLGLELRKSRAKKWSMEDWGGYQVLGKMTFSKGETVVAERLTVLLDINWELDLGQVESFSERYEAELEQELKRWAAD